MRDRNTYFAMQHKCLDRPPGGGNEALRLVGHSQDMSNFRPILPIVICLWATLPLGVAHADVRPAGPIESRRWFGYSSPTAPLAPAARPIPLATTDPGMLCRHAVNAAGRSAGIPDHLMSAIARVESGRRGSDGQVNPWPWSINVEGTDHVYDTREQVIAAVRDMQAQGKRSIDVGCMQVNLMYHPTAFSSLEQAFDPSANAAYAARFLTQLHEQTGSWPRATAAYHSATPELGDAYQRKVMSVLADETTKDLASPAANPGAPVRMLGGSLAASGAGAMMLGNHAESAKILPRAGTETARGLDAYRGAPVRVAARME